MLILLFNKNKNNTFYISDIYWDLIDRKTHLSVTACQMVWDQFVLIMVLLATEHTAFMLDWYQRWFMQQGCWGDPLWLTGCQNAITWLTIEQA